MQPSINSIVAASGEILKGGRLLQPCVIAGHERDADADFGADAVFETGSLAE